MFLRPIPNIRVGIPPIVSASFVTSSSKFDTCVMMNFNGEEISDNTLITLSPLSTKDASKSTSKNSFIKFVQLLENLFSLPSRLFAVFSHNIQYHSQNDISC